MNVVQKFVAVLVLIVFPSSVLAEVQGLAYLLGRWNADTQFYEDEVWVSAGKTRATVDTKLGNSYYVLQTDIPFPGALFKFELTISQDRFNGGYRAVFLDDLNGYMDVYRGELKEDVLTLDNQTTGTAFPDGEGGRVYGKVELSASNGGFKLVSYIKDDQSSDWAPYMRVLFGPVNEEDLGEQ